MRAPQTSPCGAPQGEIPTSERILEFKAYGDITARGDKRLICHGCAADMNDRDSRAYKAWRAAWEAHRELHTPETRAAEIAAYRAHNKVAPREPYMTAAMDVTTEEDVAIFANAIRAAFKVSA